MSKNSKRPPGGGKGPLGRGADTEPADRQQNADYDVGYGKPPKSTRFAKGKSGNPRGRPRKPKPERIRLSDAPMDRFLEQEAYRPVTLRENGKEITLSASEAVLRSLFASAIKGNRLSQKYVLEFIAAAEERRSQLRIDNYVRLEALKREGERTLAEYKRKGLPPPDLLPHPDDIYLNPTRVLAWVGGPSTPEEVEECRHTMRTRDHLVLRSVDVNDAPGEDAGCGYLMLAYLLNQNLPARFRWQDNDESLLALDYLSLTRKERKQRIATEFAELEATKPPLSLVTPEMEEEIKGLVEKYRAESANNTAAE